ncbi:MAG: hypothetical protein NWR87_00395 [Rhodospirillales bacterium]|nr:hypothetical protein [Rhodospirillales bacterium]
MKMNTHNDPGALHENNMVSEITFGAIKPALHEQIVRGRHDAHILRSRAFYRLLNKVVRMILGQQRHA